jgi:AraC family transcriptional regulator, dual regulator of chb operon
MADSVIAVSRYRARSNYSLSFVQPDQPWRYPPHKHHEHGEFIIVTRGRLVQAVNGRRVVSGVGEVMMIREDDVHELSGQTFSYYNLMFTTAALEHLEALCGSTGLQERLLSPPMPPTMMLPLEELEDLAKRLNKALLTPDADQQVLALTRIFSQIVLDYFAQLTVDQHRTDPRPPWLIEAVKQVEQNPDRSISVAGLVALAGVSAEHLSRSFRRFMGMTPSGYIAKARLERACRLLSGTNRKVLDICYQVGFSSLSYFCNLFHKEYNMSPREYRRRHSILHSAIDATTVS